MPPRLVFQLLGLPQIQLDNRPMVTDRRKAIALLAYLAVNDIGHPHQKYSRESLSALFWPDYDQTRAFSNLRRVIWEVHQAIGAGWLIAERESVQLSEEAEIDLDVARFQRLIAQAQTHGDPALRIPLLVESTKLYRGHFLTGLSLKDAPTFNEWAFAESENLRHKLAEALSRLSEDHCMLGQADQAIPYARRLVTLDPLDEASHRQLMEVYSQAGQHSLALKQFQTCEQILRKDLNLDPQPETYALYKKILKGEVQPSRLEKQAETIATRHNLPLQASSFIGRTIEQSEIRNLISTNRLVSLVGVGGIGKTRLSIQTASLLLNDFPDGIWFVELSRLSDPEHVLQMIVNTLGLMEQADRSLQTILVDFLRNKHALLVLDNCEHVIQACAELAESLLQTCPSLHLFATSREALNVSEENVYLVPTLTTPDSAQAALDTLTQYEAVQLFVERAQTALPGFTLTRHNAPAIIQVCQQLEGLPLALELAAARVKLLQVEEIAARLEDRFQLLTSGNRTALPRHQTLQALIDWSHDLLAEPERVLLRRLAVFAGGWTLEAAEHVCVDAGQDSSRPYEILDRLTSLFNKSLIIAERKEGQETRYRMLETIRQYALDKLQVAGEGHMLRQRHLAYFVDLAERAEPNLRAFDMVLWLDRLEAEHDNIRAALEWAQASDIESQLRLASALLWFWHIRGHKNEGIEWLERALSIESLDRGGQSMSLSRTMIRGKALNASGSLMVMNHEFADAPRRLEESLALFRALGAVGRPGLGYALLRLGASLPSGEIRARRILEESLALFREIGDKFGVAECLMQLAGHAASFAQKGDDYSQAILFTEEQLALRREIGDLDGIAVTLASLADMVLSQDDYPKAISLYEEARTSFRAVRNAEAESLLLNGYGDVFFQRGDYPRAAEIYEEALSLARQLSYKFLIVCNLYNLGVLAWFRGEYTRAVQLIAETQPVFRSMNHHWLFATSLHLPGDIALAAGDEAGAAQWYEEELSFNRTARLEAVQIFALEGLGKVAWAQADYELASKHFEEALRLSRAEDVKPATFNALYLLGRTAQSRGDHATARELYAQALKMQPRRVVPLFRWASLKTYQSAISYPLAACAVLTTAQKNMPRAARLFGAAKTLYTALHFEMSARERAEHDQAVAAARAALGAEAFAVDFVEGTKLTLAEAVAYALEES